MSAAKDADPTLVKEVLVLVEQQCGGRRNIKGLDTFFKGPESILFPEGKRAALRLKWEYLRRMNIRNYYKNLATHRIPPGFATLKELQEDRKKKLKNQNYDDEKDDKKDDDDEDDDDEDDDDEDDDDKDNDDSNDNDDDEASIIGVFKKLSLSPTLQTKPTHTMTSTPSSMTKQGFTSPTTENQPILPYRRDLSAPEGSKLNPFPFTVHPSWPELTQARIPFARVPNYEYGNYSHTVWEATATVPTEDIHEWDAQFVPPNGILFSAPSIGAFERHDMLCNRDCHDVQRKNQEECPFTFVAAEKTAHSAAEAAIDDDDNHGKTWWLAVIPGVKLNNAILSPGPAQTIEKDVQPRKGIGEFKDCKAAVLVWRIAEDGGTRIAVKKKRTSYVGI